VRAKRSKVNPAVEQVLRDPERVQNSKMIQEILIPIVLKIQRAIRFWIYRRKYLPYLTIKRQREKTKNVKHKLLYDMNRKYLPILPHECRHLHMKAGFLLNLRYMPSYFIEVGQQARSQLNEDDIKSIIKSRSICETKLEQASDKYRNDVIYESKLVRQENLIR
jgi:hypothetical protein